MQKYFICPETSFVQDDGESDEELNSSGEEDGGEHIIETYKQNMTAVDHENLDSTKENSVDQEAPKKNVKWL